MARVTCPKCGRERVVMPGKPKRCRRCGEHLTAAMAQPTSKPAAAKAKAGPKEPRNGQTPPSGSEPETPVSTDSQQDKAEPDAARK